MSKNKTSWKKGQSGNPKGRKAGTARIEEYQAMIEGYVPDVLKAMAEKAIDGDVAAARVILDRAFPVREAALADLLADLEELRSVLDAKRQQEQEARMQ